MYVACKGFFGGKLRQSLHHILKENKAENTAIFTQQVYFWKKWWKKLGQSPHTLKGEEKKTEIAIFRQKVPASRQNILRILKFLLSSLTCTQI